MTTLVRLDAEQARAMTEQVKEDAQGLWARLLELYEGEAHIALGYSSWGKYFEAEFGQSGRRGYQLLEAGRTFAALSEPGVHSELDEAQRVEETPKRPAARSTPRGAAQAAMQTPTPINGNGRIPLPTNEKVVRRLAATAEHSEQRAYDIWRATVEKHGPSATAEQVQEVASGVEAPAAGASEKDSKRFLSAARKALKAQDPQAAKQALAIWRASVYRELDRIAKTGT